MTSDLGSKIADIVTLGLRRRVRLAARNEAIMSVQKNGGRLFIEAPSIQDNDAWEKHFLNIALVQNSLFSIAEKAFYLDPAIVIAYAIATEMSSSDTIRQKYSTIVNNLTVNVTNDPLQKI